MTTHNIKIDIQIGRQIFDNIPEDIKPGWAGLILSRFDNYVQNVPAAINGLYPIIDKRENWKQAHNQFDKIRRFLLDNKKYQPEHYLLLAEAVAKVTYNSSKEPAPFDNDSGWYISSLALQAAAYFDNKSLEEEVKSCILIFNRNEQLKDNFTAANDFLMYRKIDDILWFDWDPIGVKGVAPRDEYQSYVPEIFCLIKSGANRNEIAERLLKFEIENMAMAGTLEKCLTIADKILQA